MKKVTNYLLLSIFVLGVASCKKSMNAQEYLQFVTDQKNGFRKVQVVDGWEFSGQYRPYAFIALIENKDQLNTNEINKRKADLAGTAWFSLAVRRSDNSISPMRFGIGSLDEYNDRLNYYLNDAVKDYLLIYGTDTLYPSGYLFENNFNLAPQETMVVSFNLPRGDKYPQKKMKLSFNDRVFKNGIINMTFSEKLVSKLPDLIF